MSSPSRRYLRKCSGPVPTSSVIGDQPFELLPAKTYSNRADTLVDLSSFMRSVRSTSSVRIRFNVRKPTTLRPISRGRPIAPRSPPASSLNNSTKDLSLQSQPRSFTTAQCRRPEMHNHVNGDLDRVVSPKNIIELPGADTSLSDLCELLHTKIYAFLEEEAPSQLLKDVQEQVRASLGALGQALDKYSLDELALSYNGGKDCLVLLILYLVARQTHFKRPDSSADSAIDIPQDRTPFPNSLACVYIQHPNSFLEVDDFVRTSSQQYHLDVASSTLPMKEAFGDYLEKHKNIKAIFVGTRRTDPHGATLTHFDPTDHGWPDFMRIHPVIDWHYVEVWAFIRHFEIPYCGLYDLGYTSLGGTKDTFPNPRLEKDGGTADKVQFRPAYELIADDEERLGRQKRSV